MFKLMFPAYVTSVDIFFSMPLTQQQVNNREKEPISEAADVFTNTL